MADQYTPEEIQAIFEEYNNATKGGSQATAQLTKEFKDANAGLKNYTANLNASLKSLGSSMLGVAKAMKDGQQGASVYNDSIEAAADAVDAFASKFGFLGKLIGTLLTAGARYAVEVNKQSDKLFDAYKNLSSSGLSDAGGMRSIFDNMQKFGYGIEQLGTMTELLKANSVALANFGGTAATGTRAFADAAVQIQHSEIGKSLQMLGKTPDEINKGMAGFIKQQQMAGVASSNIQQNLSQRSAEYIKQLDLMSKLTGESAEALQASREQAMSEDAFNQTIYELRKKGDEASMKRADELLKASDMLKTAPALQKDFWMSVGGDASAMGRMMTGGMSDFARYTQDANFEAAKGIDLVKKGNQAGRDQLGGLYKFTGALDGVTYSAKESSAIMAIGGDKSMEQNEALAKAQQELQKKALDPATKAQVEMRIEQMKTTAEFQSLINKGINPVTKGMAKLAGGIESVTDKLPGSGTSTGTKMGGGETGSNWWNPSTWGGKKETGQSGALLDLIGKGESGGNYNALVGGKTANLTNMTIAEVQELQKTMTKANGFASSAVGKYQMISATLGEQAKKAGLDVNTAKFDQKTQDMLAQQLINQAGYGKKDTATVMKNLAGTWASLPQDMSGRGRYDGYNTNKANIDPRALASAISGPNSNYDNKMSDVKPDKTLPAKETTQNAQQDPASRSEDIMASYTQALQAQQAALRDIADNTKKSATYAPV